MRESSTTGKLIWSARLQDLKPGPPARTPLVLFEGAGESLLLFHGAMVSMTMLIPANTRSISLCTRPTSDFRLSSFRRANQAHQLQSICR